LRLLRIILFVTIALTINITMRIIAVDTSVTANTYITYFCAYHLKASLIIKQ
jgi:hypothetical protein